MLRITSFALLSIIFLAASTSELNFVWNDTIQGNYHRTNLYAIQSIKLCKLLT